MIKLPTGNLLYINGAAGLIILLGFFSAARAIVATPPKPQCTQRPEIYSRTYPLSLERDGEPIRLAEFEADFGGRGFGIQDNVQIRGLAKGPARAIMVVSMPQGSASPKAPNIPSGGISFDWTPDDMPSKKFGCIAYSIYVPTDFDFGSAGSLPGIFGGYKEPPEDGNQSSFTVRPGWRKDGELILMTSNTDRNVLRADAVTGRFALPKIERGKWIELQQEFSPNDPNVENGILRLWVNGKLVIDRTDIMVVRQPNQGLLAVSFNVNFGSEMTEQYFARDHHSPKDQQLFISPVKLLFPE